MGKMCFIIRIEKKSICSLKCSLNSRCVVSEVLHIFSAYAYISKLPSGVHLLCICIITCIAIIVLKYKL